MNESKRIKRFRNQIINEIPKFPNDRRTKEILENMPLVTLFVYYLNWISRYVSIKPRKVIIESAVTNDQRWSLLKHQVEIVLEKARSGEDLTPYLSIQPHSRGYSPKTSILASTVDSWVDKDFLLNVMGFHHFHLGTKLESAGHIERTDDVLFARVNREKFTAIGIFDHSVFESIDNGMNDERKRLWEIFDEHTSQGVPEGSIFMSPPIAASGHPLHLVKLAQEYYRVILEVDPKNEPEFLRELYRGLDLETEVPSNLKLEWMLNFSDLGIYDKNHNNFFVLRKGLN
ncbi:MAG: hypothetical protein EBU46_04715 [Nitrosomonadaceae bacterium]|nr:hypothetical protein [Nitrosomonadaceae bacterium]